MEAQTASQSTERANSAGCCDFESMAELANMIPARDPVACPAESRLMHASWSAETEEEPPAAEGLEFQAQGDTLTVVS